MEKTMDKIIQLCKNRGFIYPGSEIYGGLANTWDYGPIGVELKNNVKRAWWQKFVTESPYNVGVDCAILMNPKTWEASGHLGGFSDPLMDCKECHERFRADKLIEDFANENGIDIGGSADGWSNEEMVQWINDHNVPCPSCGKHNFTDIRQFNLMFKTFQGVTEDAKNTVYLRPETAQGIFVNFKNVQRTSRKKIPFGIGQIGKSFRNEITPGNFTFRTREFEQMELEFFCEPGSDLEWFQYWRGFCRDWLKSLGIKEEEMRLRDHDPKELAFYSKGTTDIEYLFPFGWGELWGIADRTDYDLTCHQNVSGEDMSYFDDTKNEKYIPDVYLTASKRQRLELLAGLIDTDGCCSKSEHKYHFSTTSKKLRDSFIALVSTFGWRVCVTEEMPKPHPTSSGQVIIGRNICYTIGFSPTEEIPCRVERKHLTEFSNQRRIAIKAVRTIDPIRGNCIQVEDGVYCVGNTMLPTHNSTLEIFVLSGIIGWNPDKPNLVSSFSGTMTHSIYDGVNQILSDADEYSWHDIFPDVPFKAREGTNSKDQTINVGRPKRFKSLTCRAINASLTGNTRCEYLLCADDMCSGIEEALNKERLEKLWQTYNTDLKTRKKQGCKELHIATRWSTLDLIGRLKSLNENNPRARFIAVPALDGNGESNFEYDGGVGFDTAYFRDIQRSMDEISFKCLFQNEPIEREGLLYHDDELRRYLELPVDEPDAVLSIVDTKNKGTDFFVQPVMLQYGEDYYMVDTICNDDANYETQYARSANLILTNKVEACQFESNNGGDRVALEVAKRVKEAKGYCNITQQFTTQNKETKIIVYAPWVKQHVIFRDKSLYTPKSEYGKFMEMLLSHPILGKPKHDDVPDVLSSFAKWKNRPETPPTVVGRRPF